MKRLLLFVLIVLITGCVKEQYNAVPASEAINPKFTLESYYWYRGEKIQLQESPDEVFVVFDRASINGFQNPYTKSSSLHSLNSRPYYSSARIFNKQVLPENVAWAKVDKNLIDLNSVNILYSAPYYITETGKEVGLTNYFLVRLNSIADYDKLEKFAVANHVIIVSANERSLWYTLACGSHSVGNALQLANKAYESGDFAATDIVFENDFEVVTENPDYNDLYYSQQWNLTGSYGINLGGTHTITTGHPNIKVAVIDNGFQLDHPDMPVVSSGSWDATSKSSPAKQYLYDGKSYNNHGIGVASVIGAKINNDSGIAGIAPDVTLMPISVDFSISTTDTTARNPLTSLSDAIEYAVAAGADVINNSWSHHLYHEAIDIELDNALTAGRGGKGSVVVFASGNDSSRVTRYPAILHDEIIIVGGTDASGNRRESSNYSDKLDLVAPGGDIPILADMSAEDYASGTSFAAPHVAGVAALMLSVNPSLTNSQVSEILEATATKLPKHNESGVMNNPNGLWHEEVGYGIVNCHEAVVRAKSDVDLEKCFELIGFDYYGNNISFTLSSDKEIVIKWDENGADYSFVPAGSEMTIEHSYSTTAIRHISIAEYRPGANFLFSSTALTHFDLTTGSGARNIEIYSLNKALEYVRIIGGSSIVSQTITIEDLPALKDLYLVRMPDVQVVVDNCPSLQNFGSSRYIWGAPSLNIVVPIRPLPIVGGEPLDPDIVGGGTTRSWPDVPESVQSFKSLSITDCDALVNVSLENVDIGQFDFSDFPNLRYLYVSSHNDRIVGGTGNTLTMTAKGEYLANTITTLPAKGSLFKGKVLVRGVDDSNTEYVEAIVSTKYQNQIATFEDNNNWEVVWDSEVTNSSLQ